MIVVTIVALLVLAKVMITPERVKAMVVPLAETALQRKVSLGDIKIGLFSGIELHDLVIAEKNGTAGRGAAAPDDFPTDGTRRPALASRTAKDASAAPAAEIARGNLAAAVRSLTGRVRQVRKFEKPPRQAASPG